MVPVADGGDGMLDAAVAAGFEAVAVDAVGATGREHRTRFVRRGDQAVVELAEVCGLALLGEDLDPLGAGTRGVGQVLLAALDAGCTRLVLGVGGSASTDGGAGMLRALGARFLDADGRDVPDGGAGLASLDRVDLAGLDPRLHDVELAVACDVDNPLTGPSGAAAVYGPQKGATPDDVVLLDAALGRLADAVAAATGGTDLRETPGAGAAGGVAFGALAALGGTLRPGAEVVADLTGLREALAGADLVVTGEGSLDEQTLRGKAPAAVAALAASLGVPVVAVVGRCELDDARLAGAGFTAVHVLVDEAARAGDPGLAAAAPGPLLVEVGARIAREVARDG